MKNLLSHITNTKEGKAPTKRNKKLVVFIVCVFVSMFFWLMMSLSKEYIMTFTFPVNYVNMPKDKVLANQLPPSIDIQVKATGFNILNYKFKTKQKNVLVDLNDAKPLSQKNRFFILTNSRIDKLKIQFSSSINLINVNPDTIYLNYNKKVEKVVPVVSNIKISFNKQYQLVDSIKIIPFEVKISGAADIIDLINKVETIPLELTDVSSSSEVELKIKKDKTIEYLDIEPAIIKAKIEVDKFTEATISVPIIVENLPAGLTLKTFPDNVTVKYNVAFKNYEKINPNMFKVVIDYSKIEITDNRAKLKLVEFPSQAKAVKLSFEKVEYIIRKK